MSTAHITFIIPEEKSDGMPEAALEERPQDCIPKNVRELFEHTLMVGGASNYLEYYSRGENKIVATIRIAKEWEDKFYCGVRLYKVSSTLTGGAFYKDPSGNFGEELWLCPVTLFLLGKYPKLIFIYKINKNYLHCPICIE